MSTDNACIRRDFERVPADLVAQAAGYQTAILADVAGRRGALNGRIQALRPGMRLAGPALTVEVRPGDNLMIHAAMQIARPGDVLVVDGKGDLSSALMGALMFTACKKLGLAGVVIDGAARDSVELQDLGFPVFCLGTNPNGPTKNAAGRIGHAVSVGGVSVQAGDLVLGDEDGVVVVEREQLAALLPLAAAKVGDEARRLDAIHGGRIAASWLDGALRSAGVLQAGEAL
ncbi:RraA family protein [Rubrivivax gelatinosus]|uniref:Putative 4-hydroxy-4-methyl-2-oxoglutarate aldolase n=1 Tax=Rubrivivax gelatinosus TaxID=28068 RepID=A0A4R2MA74_RUBGE|nr:RraA family protein [Rubrivivax gelatinosus]MBK1688353.1 methyltransferase [Rubrivivax gelatinosus]TCP03340.1 regulator of RNase E activity RraA [Rubrivivax gelatinosus]